MNLLRSGSPSGGGRCIAKNILLRTWCILRERRELTLPDEIDSLVQTVYEEQVECTGILAGATG